MGKKLTGSKSKICSPQGDEHNILLSEFLQRLGVDESRIGEQEAARRLHECGPTVLEEIGKESILKKYIRQFRNFFSILLTVGAILSFLGEYLDPGKGNLYIEIAIGAVVVLNGTFTFIQEYQAQGRKVVNSSGAFYGLWIKRACRSCCRLLPLFCRTS